jgi:Uma2 family endonuclease
MSLAPRYQEMLLNASLPDKDAYTEEEFFALDERAEGRWEFVPLHPSPATGNGALQAGRLGLIRAMAGGTPDHSAIAGNILSTLTTSLRALGNRTCRVFGSDLKISAADGRKTYPDLSVVCGKLQMYEARRDTVTNPLVIVEVVSKSTEDDDRNGKWQSYQTIPTLAHYVLAASDRPRLDMYTREENGWHYQAIDGLEGLVTLSALGVTLALSDIYDLVEWEAGN